MSSQDDKNWSTIAHVSALIGLFTFALGFIGGFIGPLIIWLLKRDQSPVISENAKEALNFNICFAIYSLIASFTIIILIGIILVPAVYITWLVFVIIASVKTSQGQFYRYPLIFRLIN